MTKKEIKKEIAKCDYYIGSNLERGNKKRVKEIEKQRGILITKLK